MPLRGEPTINIGGLSAMRYPRFYRHRCWETHYGCHGVPCFAFVNQNSITAYAQGRNRTIRCSITEQASKNSQNLRT